MSNIEKIRQEIERRKKEFMYDSLSSTIGRYYEDRDLLAFIDSLPEEKPSEDLEEAAEEYADNNSRRWQDDGDIYYDYSKIEQAFIAGTEWQKEQMMKDAVEGEIGYWNQRGLSILLDQSLEKLGYDEDTKVKIIIVKK